MSESKVLVVGATGGTGRHVVAELRARNIPMRLLVRNLTVAREIFGEADFWEGDALLSDLDTAFVGITAVVSALGGNDLRAVDLPATVNLIRAAQKAGVGRFVLCSTIGAVPTPGVPDHLLSAFAPKGEAEAELRESGLPFTIIRPGRLIDQPMEEPRAIERRCVGQALVEALFRPDAEREIFELSQARLSREGADPILGLKV